jgi:hypothetical protein
MNTLFQFDSLHADLIAFSALFCAVAVVRDTSCLPLENGKLSLHGGKLCCQLQLCHSGHLRSSESNSHQKTNPQYPKVPFWYKRNGSLLIDPCHLVSRPLQAYMKAARVLPNASLDSLGEATS